MLSHNAIQFTINHAIPVVTWDFAGYIGRIEDTKDKINYVVDINGKFELISGDRNRPALPKRLKKKWYKKLMKYGFLESKIIPFPEFSEHLNIPLDENKVKFYPIELIKSIEYYDGVRT